MTDRFHFGVVGRDISYSKSAELFKAALSLLGKTGSCDILSVGSEQLPELIEKVRSGFYAGISVTIPYKSEIIKLLDGVDETAGSLKAVNSICARDGEVWGFNTDVDGFAFPLLELAVSKVEKSALVFGYGGAAKAVVFALADRLEFDRIVIAGRNSERLEKFRLEMSELISECELKTTANEDLVGFDLESIDLIINSTPLGGWNYPTESPFPAEFRWANKSPYYDLNYNEKNRLIEEALSHGLDVLDGSTMLVAQALRSLEIWTGLKVPFEPVYKTVFGVGV